MVKGKTAALVYNIDETFSVTVRKEGSTSANEENITTESGIASLGDERNTITFKENGQYILRVSDADGKELTKEPVVVVVVNKECVGAETYTITETEHK